MNGRIVRTIAVWAGVSCVASLTVLLPARLRATDPVALRALARPEMARPVLAGEGFEISVRVAGQPSDQPAALVKAGEPVKLELVAVSKSEQMIEVKPVVRLMSAAPVAKFSRTLPTPKEVYRTEPMITLAPGETKTVVIDTNTVVAEHAETSVALSNADREVWALRIEVASAK